MRISLSGMQEYVVSDEFSLCFISELFLSCDEILIS